MRLVLTSVVPPEADSRPDAMRSNVDLPQPLGPTIETNSPRSTVRSTPPSAAVPSGKTRSTSRKSSRVERTAGSAAVVVDMAFPSGSGDGQGREFAACLGDRDDAAAVDDDAVGGRGGDRVDEVHSPDG